MEQTIEELEIVIRARVDDAIKEIHGLTEAIKKEVTNSTKSLNKIQVPKVTTTKTIEPMKKEVHEIAKTINKEITQATSEAETGIKKMAKSIKGAKKVVNSKSNDWYKSMYKMNKEQIRMAETSPVAYGWLKPSAERSLKVMAKYPNQEQYDKEMERLNGGYGTSNKNHETEPEMSDADKMREMKKAVKDALTEEEKTIPLQRRISDSIEMLKYKWEDVKKAVVNYKNIIANRISSKNQESGKGGAKKNAGGIFAGIGSFIKSKPVNMFKSFGKTVEATFKKGLRSIKMFSLGLLGVQSAYRVVSRAVSSYLAYDQELSKSLQNSWNVLGSLLAPALEFIVGLFAKATSYVANFVKALWGIDLVARANAKSLKNQANASKQLSGIDDINNLTSDNQNPITTIDVNTSMIDDLVNKIKDGDWGGLGVEIAEKLNNAIAGIDWAGIGQTIGNGLTNAFTFAGNFLTTFDFTAFGSQLGTMVSNIITNTDWSMVGTTISGYLSALPEMILGFIESIDWVAVGTGIIDFIKGFDLGRIADAIFEGLGSALAGLGQVLATLFITGLESIWNFFGDEVENCGGNIVLGIYSGINKIMSEIGQWVVDHIFKPFINGFKKVFGIHSPSTVMSEMGGFIIDGLKNGVSGIWEKVKTIFFSLKDNIKTIFTQAWENITNIFSPQNAKETFTKVLNGIKSVFSTVATFFKNIFTEAWTNVKNVFSAGGQIFSGIKEGIENTFKKIVNTLIDGINKIVRTPFNAINSMLNKIRNISILGAEPFKSLWSYNPIGVPQIPKLAKGNVATSPTLAMFGEYHNAKSNPEITAPQKLLESSFRKVLQEQNNTGNTPTRMTIQIGSTKIFDDMIDYANTKSKANGVSVFTEI